MGWRRLELRVRVLQRRDGSWWKDWRWSGRLRLRVDRHGGQVIDVRRDTQ
jgi:hypothetical protein